MSEISSPKSAKVFKCVKPTFDKGKRVKTLVRTDRLVAGLQYVKEAGENSLQTHEQMDGIYVVVKGRAKFYGEGDVVIGEIGESEGILISRGYPYWFESTGDEMLELLLVHAFDRAMGNVRDQEADRVDF